MRGADERQAVLFSYRPNEDRVPADHPLRALLVPALPLVRPSTAANTARGGSGMSAGQPRASPSAADAMRAVPDESIPLGAAQRPR